MNVSKPFGPSGHPPALATMGTRSAVGSSASPSPRPSPPRRGRSVSRDGANLCVSQLPSRSRRFPLSSGERAGVRGNRATFVSMAEPFPGTVKLDESPGRAGGFPRRMKKRLGELSGEAWWLQKDRSLNHVRSPGLNPGPLGHLIDGFRRSMDSAWPALCRTIGSVSWLRASNVAWAPGPKLRRISWMAVWRNRASNSLS